MSGTYVVDVQATFAAPPLLMSCGPKMKFGTQEQDVSANGERKWEAQAACTFAVTPGLRPLSEVINVTITGPATNPGDSIPPGSPVIFEGFKVGVSAPEANGQTNRIRGGKPWHQATGMRAASPARTPVKSGD